MYLKTLVNDVFIGKKSSCVRFKCFKVENEPVLLLEVFKVSYR